LCLSSFLWDGPADASALQPISIVTPTRNYTFSVEVASTKEQRERGLMFRKSLPQKHGMLFDFGREQDVTMWMQNTDISLDMIFIRADGQISRIAENNQPRSRKLIPSVGAVRWVLEVRGGTVRKLGIAVGDQLVTPAYSPLRATR
jgi:uncharacterized membrane protein (UPF0127 family)